MQTIEPDSKVFGFLTIIIEIDRNESGVACWVLKPSFIIEACSKRGIANKSHQ